MTDRSDFQKLGMSDSLIRKIMNYYSIRNDALELISLISLVAGADDQDLIIMLGDHGLSLDTVHEQAWNLIDPKIRATLSSPPPPVVLGVPKPNAESADKE